VIDRKLSVYYPQNVAILFL